MLRVQIHETNLFSRAPLSNSTTFFIQGTSPERNEPRTPWYSFLCSRFRPSRDSSHPSRTPFSLSIREPSFPLEPRSSVYSSDPYNGRLPEVALINSQDSLETRDREARKVSLEFLSFAVRRSIPNDSRNS